MERRNLFLLPILASITIFLQVYNAWLRDGSSVLLKCMNVKQKHTPQITKQYNETLSKLRHQNLVSVLGHCIVNYVGNPNLSTIYVVQEFSTSGSLRDHFKGINISFFQVMFYSDMNLLMMNLLCRLEKARSSQVATQNGHHNWYCKRHPIPAQRNSPWTFWEQY